MAIPRPLDSTTDFSGGLDAESAYQHAVTLGSRARYNEKVADSTAVWANSATSGTAQTVTCTFAADRVHATGRMLAVYVRNPSTQTALNGAIQVQANDGGTTRWGRLAPFTVTANNGALTDGDGEWFLVDGGMLGEGEGGTGGVRVRLANVTTLNSSGGFTARVIVRHL